MEFGDVEGHPFRGNQYTSGSDGGAAGERRRAESAAADKRTKETMDRARYSKENSKPGEPPKMMPRDSRVGQTAKDFKSGDKVYIEDSTGKNSGKVVTPDMDDEGNRVNTDGEVIPSDRVAIEFDDGSGVYGYAPETIYKG